MICSFFGHRKVADGLAQVLFRELSAIIETANTDITFYVGDKGQFDRLVQMTLVSLKDKHPDIKVYVILDYIPVGYKNYHGLPTLIPETVERAPKRFAMSYRNRWMINECDLAVVYYYDVTGNTRKHVDMLERKKKTIINIADMMPLILDNPSNLC